MKIKKGIYKHYKGKLYEVIGVARHSETLEEMVVYKALYENEADNFWVRPLEIFTEEITINGVTLKRFEFIPNYASGV